MKESYAPSLLTVDHSSATAICSLQVSKQLAKRGKQVVLIEKVAGTELWSTLVYFLKMAHNFNSARDREAPSSVLYKISVVLSM